jgi:hypothetical protein
MYGSGGWFLPEGGVGVPGGRIPYFLFELNLILQNGKRINVFSCGNQEKLREDTNALSAFLEKPIWDAIPDYQGLMFEEMEKNEYQPLICKVRKKGSSLCYLTHLRKNKEMRCC